MSNVFYRSLGLELLGVKNDRTTLAIIDYYPQSRRLVLVDTLSGFVDIDPLHPDSILLEEIKLAHHTITHFNGLCIHGPLSFPPFFEGKKGDSAARWMQKTWSRLHDSKTRPFVPYLQRPCEIYMRHLSSEKFDIPDALGANLAPIAARLAYLKKQLPKNSKESFPRGILSRLISNLGLNKNILPLYTDFERGVDIREEFLQKLIKKLPQIFIYQKDLERLILHLNHFHAFILAFNQHLSASQQQETPPKDFPKQSGWIHLPARQIHWDEVFF